MGSELSLLNKRAFITAAGQGIGRASAEMFARAGAQVFASDINYAAVAELSAIEGITALELDVTNSDEVSKVVGRFGQIDVLFNCAGIVHSGTILDSTEQEWEFAFNLNVKSMYRITRAVLPGMIERGSGSVINMASVASSLKGVPNRFVYCASKAAVLGMTKSIASDFVAMGIRCNAICPGTVDSPSLHDRMRSTGDYTKSMNEFIARQPMGRLGRPEEIATLALYLASDASGFTTGQVHLIDGGWTL